MAAARKKKSEPSAEFTLGDVSVVLPIEPQTTLERTEQLARQELHRLADVGSVDLNLPDGLEELEPEGEPAAE